MTALDTTALRARYADDTVATAALLPMRDLLALLDEVDDLRARVALEPTCPTQGCRARWDAEQEHTCDTEALYERAEFLSAGLKRVTQERAEAHAERDDLRAKVARVEALLDEPRGRAPGVAPFDFLQATRLRAALDGAP